MLIAEKTSDSLNQVFKSVILLAKEEDNPITKMRSLMLKSISGNRDIGQSEVCRLLFSDPHYHTDFTHITISLDYHHKQINLQDNEENTTAFKMSMLELYANRLTNPFFKSYNVENINFITFARQFYISKNTIHFRLNSNKIVIVTLPRVYYQPPIPEYYEKYCFYQLTFLRR